MKQPVFKNGQPIVFSFLHNAEKAPQRIRGADDPYQQAIEPAGFYMLVDDDPSSPLTPGWVRGMAKFRKPLVVPWNTGPGGYDEKSWKAHLSEFYGGKRGKALSRALLRDGYDAVVTIRRGEAAEIVDLARIR